MDFEQLGRKELQALAKQYKIKANLSNAALVEALKNAIVTDYENSRIEDDELMLDDEPVAIVEPVAVEQPTETVVEPVAAPAPETVEEKVSGKKRKVAFGPEVSGPFSVDEAAIETTSPLFNRNGRNTVQQPATPFVFEKKAPEPLKIGDKVRVCVDSVWITSVIKRVNKASFRVQMESGEEATVKPADIRIEEEEEEEQEEEEGQEEETTVAAEAVAAEEEVAVAPGATESLQAEAVMEPEEDDLEEADFHDAVDDSLVLDASIAMDADDDHLIDDDHVAPAGPTVTFVDDFGDLLQSPSPVVEQQRTPSKTTASGAAALSARHSIAVSTPSAPRSARKSITSARKSVSTPSRASLPMQPWNSSTKPTFHIGSSHDTAAATATTRGSKTPLSEKKRPASAAVKPITPTRRASTTTATAAVVAAATNGGSSQPAILSKMNAAQRMRLEALQKKKDAEKSLVAAVNPAHATAFTLAATAPAAVSTATATAVGGSQQPPLKKARTVPTPLSTGPSVTAKHPASGRSTDRTKLVTSLPNVATVKPKTGPLSAVLEDEAKKPEPITSVKTIKTTATASSSSSSAAARKTTPNFDRLHQKTFEKQKALTSCVSRDIKINKNMDTAFAKASTDDATTITATTTTATTTASEAENQQHVANAAPATKATFVTKRKAHVAFDTADVGRKDSDHLGSLLSGSGATPGRPSAPAHEPVAKKSRTVTEATTAAAPQPIARKSDVRKTLSVAEKTTAAAVASKAIVLSRKSEIAPKANANKAPLVNSRKSIRL